MCYYKSVKTTSKEIVKALNAVFPKADLFQPVYFINGYSHPALPVLSMEGGRSIDLFNWGLIPNWSKDWAYANDARKKTLNARSETVFEISYFRDSVTKRRCIIPVTGFYEWKHIKETQQDKKGVLKEVVVDKMPYLIHPKEQELFYLAGIYSIWKEPVTGVEMKTYSVLTGPANELMADIHNSAKRQPLMIDRRNVDAWIDPGLPKAGIIELMQPCDDSDMAAYTVTKSIGNSKIDNNNPEVLKPFDYGTVPD